MKSGEELGANIECVEAEAVAAWLRGLGTEAKATKVLSMCLAMAAEKSDVGLAKRLLALGANPAHAEISAIPGEKAAIEGIDRTEWIAPWTAAIAADSAECLAAMAEAGLPRVRPGLLFPQGVVQENLLAEIAAAKGAPKCLKMALGWAREDDPARLWQIESKAWRAIAYGDAGAREVEAMANALIGAGSDIDGHCPVEDRHDQSESPLELAASQNPLAVKGLLAAGADPNKGRPVAIATESWDESSLSCLTLLLAAGGDPEMMQDGGPLQDAIERDWDQKVLALIAAGAKIERLFTPSGLGMLAFAASSGAARCVEALLVAGLDPDEKVEGLPIDKWVEQESKANHPRALRLGWERSIEIIRAASEAKALAVASGKETVKRGAPRI